MKNLSKKQWLMIGGGVVVVIILIIVFSKPSTPLASSAGVPVTPAPSTSLWTSIVNGATAIVGDFTKGSSTTSTYVQVPPVNANGCDANGNNKSGQPC